VWGVLNGDMIIISPLFRILKEKGYHVICHTGKRGLNVLKGNPYIDEYIEYLKEGQENKDVDKEWEELEKKIGADYSKNFAESIEVQVSSHPKSAAYNYPKNETLPRLKQNFYDATMKWAGFPEYTGLKPELFIDKKEEDKVKHHIRKKQFNILWAWSGSGQNKAYPWAEFVMGDLLKRGDIHIITVGDEKCQILEFNSSHKNLTKLSGKISYRESIVLAKLADLVVAPDTGLLHAAGAFSTPKIGILGHTTIENITKYFDNDYSLEPLEGTCECAPCHKLIYDNKLQCPIDNLNGASWCMSKGHPPERLLNQILKVKNVRKNHSR